MATGAPRPNAARMATRTEPLIVVAVGLAILVVSHVLIPELLAMLPANAVALAHAATLAIIQAAMVISRVVAWGLLALGVCMIIKGEFY